MGEQHLLSLEPVPSLLGRIRVDLAGEFSADRLIRISRAPGRLDVMGGIADYTGSLVCEATLQCAAAAALQERDDRNVRVLSLNLHDEDQPFVVQISLDELADRSIGTLQTEFNQPGRRWAGYLAGCLAILHHRKQIDLKNPSQRGMNLALLSTVPLGAGVSSSAAIEVAAMINFMDHLGIRGDDPMSLAALCQEVENRVVGAPSGIMDQVSSCAGEEGTLLRMVCQPHELRPSLRLPAEIRALGVNSNVRHSVGGGMYGRTRCAAFMGHRIILEKMREMGQAEGATLTSDPMRGYLANLDADDYKKFFRPYLPEELDGRTFLSKFGATFDTATRVEADVIYHVRKATDHHVLEARRVRNFVQYLEQAAMLPAGSPQRHLALDKAGHLMYASHLSYTNDALLGASECDVLVQLVRDREPAGLYGAKITGGGSGGTVAVLADGSTSADDAIAEIMADYEKQTGRKPQALLGSSPGAWAVGTVEIQLGRLSAEFSQNA
jgi:galactokinase